MENFTLHAITIELGQLLKGRRILRVFQTGVTDLYVDLNLRDGRWLFISTDPTRLAVFLTALPPDKSQSRTDTSFVSLFRKHVTGAVIKDVHHLGYDRLLIFDLDYEQEDGTIESDRRLVVQLTGRAANVLALKGETVLASLRAGVEPGAEWTEPPPPADKVDPTECPREILDEDISRMGGDIAAAARNRLLGFGTLYAEELAVRARHEDAGAALKAMMREIFELPPVPTVYSQEPLPEIMSRPGGGSAIPLLSVIRMESQDRLLATTYPGINLAVDAWYQAQAARRSFVGEKTRLESMLQQKLKRSASLLQNLEREQKQFRSGEGDQRLGELLMAGGTRAVKNGDSFRTIDFYSEEACEIDIPALGKATPYEAAESYFKRARKARNGLARLTERIPEVEREIARLKRVKGELGSCMSLGELSQFALNAGLSAPEKKPQGQTSEKKAKRNETIPGTRKYRSTDGFEILVGRTSRDNDHLTMRVAKSFDLWLHAADYPGSHVILRNPKRGEIPQRSIVEAAELAAKFSQANNDSGARIAVNYCQRKFVSKPKGFGPGQVRLSSYKTVLVEAREAGTREL